MLENAVSQHVLRRIVAMRPDQRHSIAVLVLERTVQNRPPVRAPQAILRGPTTEVGLTAMAECIKLFSGEESPKSSRGTLLPF
jgi:hypothetical protein